ncbi:DUF4232 domain-containing protein [Streptomyces sp. NPDC047042]|uniref:DUF4232 domain-containing protein n=1 Tax=Streptomyces sp. NPDC047042 TaxID=3154807 RepID=UPI00341046D8
MAAASSAVLALALTACGGGDGESESGASATPESTGVTATASSTPASPSASASATGTEEATPDTSSEGSGEGGGAGAEATKSSSTGKGTSTVKPVDCATSSLRFAVKAVRNPVNHVLITATNNGTKACHLYSYPALRISENSQSVTAVIGESKPQAVVTLDRGATAYAGLITASSDRNSEIKVTTPSIGLSLFGPDEEGTDAEVEVPVPGGSLYVEEDNAQVTYWQDTPNDALTW